MALMADLNRSDFVSVTVTSHDGLPFAHGSSVTPSGRLPSSRLRPGGSFTYWGACALLKDRHKISLSWLCRWCLGPLLRHARPWSPRALTALPHTQVCGTQALHPSLCATATRTDWLIEQGLTSPPTQYRLYGRRLHQTVIDLPMLSVVRGSSHRCGGMMQLGVWPCPCHWKWNLYFKQTNRC